MNGRFPNGPDPGASASSSAEAVATDPFPGTPGREVALTEAVAVAEENTIKVLDTHQLVAARINDLLAGLRDDDIRKQEQSLHEKLAQQISDLPLVAAAWAIDAAGHELVSARVYPVNRGLDQSQREDFRQ
jgi:hypothetical protein